MSVKRRDLVRHLTESGFRLLREGANHSIFTNGAKVVRTIHSARYAERNIFDRINRIDRIVALDTAPSGF